MAPVLSGDAAPGSEGSSLVAIEMQQLIPGRADMARSKVIVTVAPTGGMGSKQANPNLPTQPREIADSVYRSFKAGASIAALRARRPDDLATCNADIYRQINSQIRARCDIIINNSTGGGSTGDMLTPRSDGMFESNFDALRASTPVPKWRHSMDSPP
jgi:beta-keto acid cleavage enzyme